MTTIEQDNTIINLSTYVLFDTDITIDQDNTLINLSTYQLGMFIPINENINIINLDKHFIGID